VVRINIREVLRFFDGEDREACKHSSALNGLLGEELGIALLEACLKTKAYSDVEVIDQPCTQGTSRGVRLDRWIFAERPGERIAFQVEVKNWCAHSLGGRPLPVDPDHASLAAHLKQNWARYWNHELSQPAEKGLLKVLTPMLLPDQGEGRQVEPVACVWDGLHPDGQLDPWFPSKPSGSFHRLWWFSMSSFLRLTARENEETLALDLRHAEARIDHLERMLTRKQMATPNRREGPDASRVT
jgi:hypothetical protein